jgi:pimeloyl-ACP methyl ester carboxylesterase
MSAVFSLPKISTNVRFSAERLFLTPPRARDAAASALDLIDARSELIEHKGRHIAAWRWGSRDAPAVLLAHGWGGHAAQMRAFVFPLLGAGYRVIAYDQPAHGVSGGRLTGLPDFAEVLAEVAWHYGEVHAVIAHSLGGTAAALAHARGLPLQKMVLVNPPSDMDGYSRRFARWHWIPEPVRRSMQAAIEERYGVRWEELELSRLAPRLRAQALVIHDRADRAVPWPGARFLGMQGVGRRRILEDEGVTRAAADFISGRT